MEHSPINIKFAIAFLVVLNLFCLWVFWSGVNGLKEILASLHSHVEIIRVGSRAGFFVVVIGVPILYSLVLMEKYWKGFVRKHSKVINMCTMIGVLCLLQDSLDHLGSAILDRLLHHAETVVIQGKSYRMKENIEI